MQLWLDHTTVDDSYDFVLFYLTNFQGLLGEVDKLAGRFAAINSKASPLDAAHEIGHLFGLKHPWRGGPARVDVVPDFEASRLMGYGNGVSLRSPEWRTIATYERLP
jgi:hypothetical protein